MHFTCLMHIFNWPRRPIINHLKCICIRKVKSRIPVAHFRISRTTTMFSGVPLKYFWYCRPRTPPLPMKNGCITYATSFMMWLDDARIRKLCSPMWYEDMEIVLLMFEYDWEWEGAVHSTDGNALLVRAYVYSKFCRLYGCRIYELQYWRYIYWFYMVDAIFTGFCFRICRIIMGRLFANLRQ